MLFKRKVDDERRLIKKLNLRTYVRYMGSGGVIYFTLHFLVSIYQYFKFQINALNSFRGYSALDKEGDYPE